MLEFSSAVLPAPSPYCILTKEEENGEPAYPGAVTIKRELVAW